MTVSLLIDLETYIADENILWGPVNKDTIISTHKPKQMGYQQLEGKVSFTPRVDSPPHREAPLRKKLLSFRIETVPFSDLLLHSKKFSCKVNFL